MKRKRKENKDPALANEENRSEKQENKDPAFANKENKKIRIQPWQIRKIRQMKK